MVYGIAWHPDSRRLATAGTDKVARLWDGDEGRLLHAADPVSHALNSVAWHPKGEFLATGAGDGRVHLWRLAVPPSVEEPAR
jgi:WD40 repeat protein